MNILLQLKDKMIEIINQINVGECPFTNTDASEILENIKDHYKNKRMYTFEVSIKKGVSIDELWRMVDRGDFPRPHKDEDDNLFWYNTEIN